MPIASTDTASAVCAGCGERLALTEFGVDRAQRSGRRSRCKACCRAATAAFRAARPDYKADWQRRRPDRVAAYNRAQAAKNVSWHARYPVQARVMNQRRRARLAGASGVCTALQLAARVAVYGGRCWVCGADYEQIDHVKPLAAGGCNWPSNQRPICRKCNRAKGARWPIDKELLGAHRVH